MPTRHYGPIAGVPVGATFATRMDLYKAGVHRLTQGGITGGGDGSESIVLNEGYVDDFDLGYEVIYTGHEGGIRTRADRNATKNSRRAIKASRFAATKASLSESAEARRSSLLTARGRAIDTTVSIASRSTGVMRGVMDTSSGGLSFAGSPARRRSGVHSRCHHLRSLLPQTSAHR